MLNIFVPVNLLIMWSTLVEIANFNLIPTDYIKDQIFNTLKIVDSKRSTHNTAFNAMDIFWLQIFQLLFLTRMTFQNYKSIKKPKLSIYGSGTSFHCLSFDHALSVSFKEICQVLCINVSL